MTADLTAAFLAAAHKKASIFAVPENGKVTLHYPESTLALCCTVHW